MDIKTLIHYLEINYKSPAARKAAEIADLWHRIENGEGQDELIIKFRNKETRKQQEQAVHIHQARSPYLVNKLKSVYRKSDRADGRIDTVMHENDAHLKAIAGQMDRFVGAQTLDSWLTTTYEKFQFIDPNAYILFNVRPYDPLKEQPHADPSVITSDRLVNAAYKYGVLESLTFTDVLNVQTSKGDLEPVKRILHYTTDTAYTVERVEDRKKTPEAYNTEARKGYYLTHDRTTYFITEHATGAKRVPAIRIGYRSSTDKIAGRVPDNLYSVPISAAKGLFIEIINKKTTYDLHLALHGFLKTFAYVSPCNYRHPDTGVRCLNGRVGESPCKACNNTGKQKYHISEQDVITLTLPDHAENNELVDLSKLIYTHKVDTDIIKMHRDEVTALEPKISLAVFNTDMFDRKDVTSGTATEINANLSHTNNEIHAYDKRRAEVWEFAVNQIANYLDYESGLSVSRKVPSDYKIESLAELLATLKAANEANAAYETKKAIQRRILEKQNVDNGEKVDIIEARETWRPFAGYPDGERVSAITLLPDDHPKRVLYFNFNEIFNDIESEDAFTVARVEVNGTPTQMATFKMPFYRLPYKVQKQVIAQYIRAYTETPDTINPRAANA